MITRVIGRSDSAGEFHERWDALERQAASSALFGAGYDPYLLDLIRSSAGTILREFYPFTSLSRLCLARSPYPFLDIQPGHVEFYADGRYRVMAGSPYPAGSVVPTELETDDARTAVAGLVRLVESTAS